MDSVSSGLASSMARQQSLAAWTSINSWCQGPYGPQNKWKNGSANWDNNSSMCLFKALSSWYRRIVWQLGVVGVGDHRW
uniref:Uncharacterized protein n=1 Tax=Romanomermis culicivorax TaxID=13658 RepID=A0A915J1U1_ROMCU